MPYSTQSFIFFVSDRLQKYYWKSVGERMYPNNNSNNFNNSNNKKIVAPSEWIVM